MAAQSNVSLEKCVLLKCLCGVWKLNSSAHCRTEAPVCILLLKYSLIFGHTDKSNTSFKSVKTKFIFVH